jgi:ABC-type phosphate transport system substrate-binding protein
VFVAGIAALGASAAAVGSALPAGAAASPTPNAQNSIIVGSGSATTYNMMQAIDTIFNDAEISACPMFESAVGQSSQPQQLDFRCATFSGGTFGPFGGATALNPYNDAAVEESPLGSSNGIAMLADAGGAFGSSVLDYTGINFARSSRDPGGSDPSGMNFVAYARDGVPFIHFSKVANLPTPSAKVVSLTQAQLQGIFLGYSGTAPVLTLWNQVQIGTLKCAAVGPVVVPSVTVTSGLNTLTVSGSFPGTVVNNQYIVGAGIPSGTQVTNVSGGTVTMSANANANHVESVTFETFNSPICTAAAQIVPAYAISPSAPNGNAPIIVISAQEGSGTQSTFKTFLGKDPSANNKVNCDPGLGTSGLPPVPTTCYGPLVVFENELNQINASNDSSGGFWTSGQNNYLTPPAGSSLPWSTTQGGAGSMSVSDIYNDGIFFYSYGKWAQQCLIHQCGAMHLPVGDTAVLGAVGGTANPGTGNHTGGNAAVWAIGVKPTEATILQGHFPVDRYLYNVYSNGTNATAAYSGCTIYGSGPATTVVTVPSVSLTSGDVHATVAGAFPGSVAPGQYIVGPDVPTGTYVVSVGPANTVVMSNKATATATESLDFDTYPTACTGGIPEATAPTLNYVSEVGAICKASTEFNVDFNTGKSYLNEYQAAIKANGFFPLSAGAAAGTINSSPLDEGDVGLLGANDGYAILHAYSVAHPGKADVDFITSNVDQEYSESAWGSGQTNGTFVATSTTGDPMGYCLVSTTGT